MTAGRQTTNRGAFRLSVAPLPRLLLAALVGLAGETAAQKPPWTATGPNCAAVLAVAFAGGGSREAYAAPLLDPPTLFVSRDNGASWEPTATRPRSSFLPILDVDVDPTDDRVVWVAGGGVFKSENRGRSWTNLGRGLPQPPNAWDLEIHPTDPDLVHVVSEGQLYRSSNGGRNWRRISSAGPILDYAVDPRDPDRVWTSSFDDVLRTTNGGRSWGVASDGLTRAGPLALDPTAPSTLYTAVRGQVYRTTNGRRWERLGSYGVDPGVEASFVSIDPDETSDLLLGVDFADADEPGLWRSTDGGRTWKAMGLVGEEPESIARHPDRHRITLIGTTDSLYRSLQGGRRPAPSQSGLFGGPVSELAVVPAPAAAAGQPVSYAATRCGLFSRRHRRSTWTLEDRDSFYFGTALAVSPADPRFLYRGMPRRFHPFHSIEVSADGGASWEVAVAWSNGLQALEIQASPADPRRVYASADSVGLYISADGGATWKHPLVGATRGLTPSVIVPHPTAAATVFAGSRGLIQSTDGGESWRQIADFAVRDLAIDPARPQTIYALGDALHRSRDGGDSWRELSVELPDRAELNSVVVDGANGGTVYVAHTTGVLRSTDGGRTWKPFDRGLPRQLEIARGPHRRLELTSRGELLLATDHGVYVTRAR